MANKLRPVNALRLISTALYPPATKRIMPKGETYWMTSDAYYNLEGAIIDLERTKADPVCIRTIRRVQEQISRVTDILERAGVDVKNRD